MFLKLAFFLGLVISVFGEGEIVFLQSPSSISFQGQQKLPLSLVKDVLSACLGFSVQEGSDWRGMKVNDPFGYAAAVVGVSVPGLPSLDTSQGHKFPLETDSPLDNVWSALEWRIAERYPYSDNESVFYFSLDEGKVSSEIHLGSLNVEPTNLSVLKYLNPEISDDKQYIEQIALLNSIAKKVEKDGLNHDSVPDVYWIVVSGLHPLIDRYGLKSKPVFEAKQLLDASLQRLTEAFNKAYNSKVLIAAMASDAPHTRRYRRDAKDGVVSDKVLYNLADTYSSDFPAMFNIFLWFGIVYAFTLLAVTLGIADMDPGRDSIIYRMTSNRMKKDN